MLFWQVQNGFCNNQLLHSPIQTNTSAYSQLSPCKSHFQFYEPNLKKIVLWIKNQSHYDFKILKDVLSQEWEYKILHMSGF